MFSNYIGRITTTALSGAVLRTNPMIHDEGAHNIRQIQ